MRHLGPGPFWEHRDPWEPSGPRCSPNRPLSGCRDSLITGLPADVQGSEIDAWPRERRDDCLVRSEHPEPELWHYFPNGGEPESGSQAIDTPRISAQL